MMHLRFWLLLITAALCLPSFSQDVLAKRKLEDFETESGEIYPFEFWGQAKNTQFLAHDPMLRLDDGRMAMLWKPDKINSRLRKLTRYNLLLEEDWSVDWELDRNEYILGMVQQSDTLCVITADYEFFQQQHLIRVRRFDLAEGKELAPELLEIVAGRQYDEVLFAKSPDGQQFVLYHLGHERENRRVSFSYSYVDHQDQIGYLAYKVRRVFFSIYDRGLHTQRRDTLLLPDRRHVLVGCDLDNDGSFYAYLFRRKGKVKVFRSPGDGRESQMLAFDPEMRDVYDFLEGYQSHLPPELGQAGHIWWAFAERKKRGRDRGIKGYQVVLFDFNQEEIDASRKVPITSTLLVAAEKQREAYSLRPMRRFDEYRIFDLIELPNDHTWLLTQKYVYSNFNSANLGFPRREQVEERVEEMILFEFDAQGRIQQALVVPTVQYARHPTDRLGLFYHAHVDTARQMLHLLTREADGEKMRRPDRLFYRKIDLQTGDVSQRKRLYEGERRYQHWVKAYTTWLTPVIATTMIIDGTNGDPFLVTVNLEATPASDEEDNVGQKE